MDAWFMFIIGLIVLLVGITVLGSIGFILEFIHKSILEPILIWYDERRYARKNASLPEIRLDFDDDERCPCCGRRKYCHCDDDDYCDRCGQRKYCHCDDDDYCDRCGQRKYRHCDDDDYCDRCGQRKYRHHCDDERF